MRYLGLRSLTQFLRGHQPGPESGTFKLYWSEYHQEVTELAVDILGADAMTPSGRWPTSSFQTDSPGAPNDSASWVGTFYNARAGTIYAGSSEIQRNIVGELVLGLPKEPRGADPGSWREQQAARSLTLGWAFARGARPSCRTRPCGAPGCARSRRLARPGWWRRPPFLPLPAPDYLRFRMETAYGGAGDQRAGPRRPRHLPALVPRLPGVARDNDPSPVERPR